MESSHPRERSPLSVPAAIVLAGALIALAVLIADTKTTTPGNIAAPLQNPTTEGQAMKPISTEDHIIGNPNAELVIVEFSDASCPYCKSFHTTMRSCGVFTRLGDYNS
jgi:protein-disulfide isomerase